ncbi:MAG: hypothetical protein M1825_003815 [Sarcosagium campestre]|nr:MAG: hypothetical protein M1825_003815 [Sarcosagium campestre]
MHFSTLLPIALAAAPSLVTAVTGKGELGFAIGTKHPDGTCKFTKDYEADFDVLKSQGTIVRGYDANDCDFAKQILPAAKSKGFKVILGIWPDTDESFSNGKSAVKAYANQYKDQVHAVTVGSETLYRGNFTGDELVKKIKEVKSIVPGIKVGTADSWNKYQDGTADPVIEAADILLVNAFAYWQGSEIKNASHVFFDDIMQALKHVRKINKKVEFRVGETGWPTGGSTYEDAVPSVANAKKFWKEGICAMVKWGVHTFAFEAFDEPWKPKSIGKNGQEMDETHWGVYPATSNPSPKWDLNIKGQKLPFSPAALVKVADAKRIELASSVGEYVPNPPEVVTESHCGPPLSDLGDSDLDGVQSSKHSSALSSRLSGSSRGFQPLPASSRHLQLSSPERVLPAESTQYYTASWGSPYSQPTPGADRKERESNRTSIGSDATDDSPVQRLRSKRHLPAQEDPDRGYWWSDDAGDSTRQLSPTRQPNQSPEDDGDLRLDVVLREAKLRSTALKGFLERKEDSYLRDTFAESKSFRRHRLRESTETLRQEDIWSAPDDTPRRNTHSESMFASKYADSPPPVENEPSVEVPEYFELNSATKASLADKELPKVPTADQDSLPANGKDEIGNVIDDAAAIVLPLRKSGVVGLTPRKRFVVKGRTHAVALPIYKSPDTLPSSQIPLKRAEVIQRLQDWEDLGYDVGGLSHLDPPEIEGQVHGRGQSSAIYPSPEETRAALKNGDFKVYIPNRQEWDDYVTHLKEEKLRALGVSIGDDTPGTGVSPTPTTMSRQASAQYPPLPFSPPLPTSSSASNHVVQHANPFTPPYFPGNSTNPSSHGASVASPVSSHTSVTGMHVGRPSVAYSGSDKRYGSPFQFPQHQPTPPIQTLWNPAQMQRQLSGHRDGSPAMPTTMPNLGSLLPARSPFEQDNIQPGRDGVASQYPEQQQGQRQDQPIHDATIQAAMPSRRVLDSKVVEDSKSASPLLTDTATPVPSGHRYNESESLQREIDDAEYHLENSIEDQLVESDGRVDVTSPFDTGDLMLDSFVVPKLSPPTHNVKSESNNQPVYKGEPSDDDHPVEIKTSPTFHHPRPHNRLHSITQQLRSEDDTVLSKMDPEADHDEENTKADSVELDANRSVANTPQSLDPNLDQATQEPSSVSNKSWSDWKQAENPTSLKEPDPRPLQPQHGSISSISKLNVDAKEFRFDPKSSFTPGNFSFSNNNFQPTFGTFPNFGSQAHSVRLPPNSDSRPRATSKLNVEAAAFQPKGLLGSKFSAGEFNFSTAAPSFLPGKSGFNAPHSANGNQESVGEITAPTQDSAAKNRIFDFNGIVKPVKESKAIPIVRPDETESLSSGDDADDHVEDESGHITQGGGSSKRRRHRDQDDEVPQFAIPTQPLNEIGGVQLAHGDAQKDKEPPPMGKENVVPDAKNQTLAAQEVSVRPAMQPQRKSFLEDPPDYDGRSWERFEFSRRDESLRSEIPTKASRSLDLSHEPLSTDRKEHAGDLSVKGPSPQLPLAVPSTTRTDVVKTPSKNQAGPIKRGGLSATAKPFEFVPSGASIPNTISNIQKDAPRDDTPPLSAVLPAQDEAPSEAVPLRDTEMETDSPKLGSVVLEPSVQDSTHQDAISEESLSDVVPLDATKGLEEDADNHTPTAKATLGAIPILDDPSSPGRFHAESYLRSDAPSPSPRRIQQISFSTERSIPHPARHGLSELGPGSQLVQPGSPLHRLNSPGDVQPSDWDDFLSPSEDVKLQSRGRFFDSQVDSVFGSLLEERLGPIEAALSKIQDLVEIRGAKRYVLPRGRHAVSGDHLDSDADDEDEGDYDDVASGVRAGMLSPSRDRKLEKLKIAMAEVLATQNTAQQSDLAQIQQSIRDLQHATASISADEHRGVALRSIIDEALNQHVTLLRSDQRQLQSESQDGKVRELEQALVAAEASAREAYDSRNALQREMVEIQARLKAATEEATKQRDLTLEKERKLRDLDEERRQVLVQTQMRTALLEGAQENLEKAKADLSTKNLSLESALQDARVAENRRKADYERSQAEKADLRRVIDTLRAQTEEVVRTREASHAKFSGLQEDMAKLSKGIAHEQAAWQRLDADHRARHEILGARLEAEGRTRERLEREIERLEGQERDAMRLRVQIEHVQGSNQHLQSVINTLRLETIGHEKTAAKFEREFDEAREAGRVEVQRTKILMSADIEAANNQVNMIRATLESEIDRAKSELDRAYEQAQEDRQRFDRRLDEAMAGKEAALEEQLQKYERHLEDVTFQNERSLQNAIEDKERTESHLLQRLSLADVKTEHLQGRVAHLEDALEVARSAANAAVQAAQNAKGLAAAAPSPAHAGSSVATKDGAMPEKISPQALRESILVLQEQLQEREGRIEKLESELSMVDADAPAKIADRDSEIGWLRELLGVRIGDLEDIVSNLSQPDFDADTVKDAAIRLKANLQMQQQERERATAAGGTQRLPSLSSISSFASPKAVLPLAAAWGNWRKVRDSSMGNLSSISLPGSRTPSSRTPSKHERPSPSFLGGLLTPPSTNLKSSPREQTEISPRQFPARRSERSTPQPRSPVSSRRAEKRRLAAVPSTPPLLRGTSYDDDAKDAKDDDFIGSGATYEDDQSTIDGVAIDDGHVDEPFGPVIGSPP